MPFVQVADVGDDMKLVETTKQTISKLAQPMSVFIPKGAVVVTLQGSIGRVAITQYEAFLDRTVLYFEKYTQAIDKVFWSYIIKNKFEYEAQRAPGGTIKTITKEALSDFDLLLPKYDEQIKIGAYFQKLDNLITLHQRKYAKFMHKLIKLEMRKKEKNVNAWEQRKLMDYLDVSKDKNKDEVFDKEDVLSVSGDYGIVNQIEFQGRSFAGVSVANYGVVDMGDVVYTKSPLKSNPYGIIKTNKGKAGIVSTLYAVYKPRDNVYSEFVQIYFEQDARMNNYMHPLVNKGAKNDMKVSDENALKGEVCFPNREEQIKLSDFFANLDHLITLHQRKPFCREREVDTYAKGNTYNRPVL